MRCVSLGIREPQFKKPLVQSIFGRVLFLVYARLATRECRNFKSAVLRVQKIRSPGVSRIPLISLCPASWVLTQMPDMTIDSRHLAFVFIYLAKRMAAFLGHTEKEKTKRGSLSLSLFYLRINCVFSFECVYARKTKRWEEFPTIRDFGRWSPFCLYGQLRKRINSSEIMRSFRSISAG